MCATAMERLFYGYWKHSDQLEVILINSMAVEVMENNYLTKGLLF